MRTTVAASVAGVSSSYTDPVWRITIELRPVERRLLVHPLLRRLQFIAHAGAAQVTTPQLYSRLEHSMGVLCLAAYFTPRAYDVRAAALMHDIGHLPFSHTLEGLIEHDHHQLGQHAVCELAGLLTAYGTEPERLAHLLDGTAVSPLGGTPGLLNLDHLDSFVRSGSAHGWLSLDAPTLLRGLRLTGPAVDTSAATAGAIVDLVCREAAFHVSFDNVASVAILRSLVCQLLPDLDHIELAQSTDAEVWALLLSDERTARQTQRLRFALHEAEVNAVAANDPSCNYCVRKIYRSKPLIDGRELSDIAPDLDARLNQLDDLPRHFCVEWSGSGSLPPAQPIRRSGQRPGTPAGGPYVTWDLPQ